MVGWRILNLTFLIVGKAAWKVKKEIQKSCLKKIQSIQDGLKKGEKQLGKLRIQQRSLQFKYSTTKLNK